MKTLLLAATMVVSGAALAGAGYFTNAPKKGYDCYEYGESGQYVCYKSKKAKRAKKVRSSGSQYQCDMGDYPKWACDAFTPQR